MNPPESAESRVVVTTFHPGEYVRDELEARGMSMVMFTKLMGWSKCDPEQLAQRLVAEQLDVDEDIAWRLGRTFGTGVKLWLNLQATYDAHRLSDGTREGPN